MADQQILPIDIIFDSKSERALSTAGYVNRRDKPTFLLDSLPNIVGMSVMWVNIPFTFYTIDQDNRTFDIYFFPDWHTLTLEPGTYTPIQFQQEFRRALDALGPITGVIPEEWYCLITAYDSRLTIYNKSVVPGGFAFAVRFPYAELADMLGFQPVVEYQSGIKDIYADGKLEQANADYVKGDTTVKLIGTPRINIHSSLSGLNFGQIRNDKDSNVTNCILQMPIISSPGAYMFYQPNPAMIPIQRTLVSSVEFYLTRGDRERYIKIDGSVVSHLPLNGDGFQICIRFYQDNGVVQMGAIK